MYLVALSLVMVVIMAFAVISITPPTTSDNKDATDLDQDMGTCGDGLIWDYSWYTIYIYYTGTGTGKMYDYSPENPAPWSDMPVLMVNFDRNVKYIGRYAFADVDDLFLLFFNQRKEEIGDHAFYECDSITDIKILGNIKIIGESAFEECSKLEAVELQEGINSICDYAFKGCIELRNVVLPNSLATIGTGVLYDCPYLPDMNLNLDAVAGLASVSPVMAPALIRPN